MSKYKAGNESFLDDEKELYYAYVGLNKPNMPLIAAYYGNTPSLAIKAANEAARLLNRKETEMEVLAD